MASISGGDKLEAKLRELAAKVSRPATLRVGFLENARYPDGTPVAMIAAIHNWGAPSRGIPPRPFFSNMIKAKKGEWPAAIAEQLRVADWDAAVALDVVGAAIAGQLRESVIETNSPPLKDATIVRKGGTRGMKYDPKNRATFPAKPLIDTGWMYENIDHEVKA